MENLGNLGTLQSSVCFLGNERHAPGPRASGIRFYFLSTELKKGKEKMSPRPKITFKNILRVSVFYETLLCISQCRGDREPGGFGQVTA